MAAKSAKAAPKKRVKVLIADDQTLFREGIKDLLENEKSVEVIGEAADGQEVVRLAKKLRPDVILMDIKLPHLDGVSATRQIRKELPNTNV
ncbi:MAG: response regulator transcription factor, partial [Elusimicrobia bacterium]|nr:response regulator transcription factor [Elusimicrobiota bacterium]